MKIYICIFAALAVATLAMALPEPEAAPNPILLSDPYANPFFPGLFGGENGGFRFGGERGGIDRGFNPFGIFGGGGREGGREGGLFFGRRRR